MQSFTVSDRVLDCMNPGYTNINHDLGGDGGEAYDNTLYQTSQDPCCTHSASVSVAYDSECFGCP